MSFRWLAILVMVAAACTGCREPSGARVHHWVALPNAYATHFQVFADGGTYRLLVFGHGGRRDTVTDAVVSAPFHRVAIASTTHAAFIGALYRTQAIVGCAGTRGARDPALRKAIDDGLVVEIGTPDGMDRERTIALKPDAVFGYPFGGEGSALHDLGIPVLQVSEYLEEHPLGRAEWLRFFGVVLGRIAMADSLFRGIALRYERVRVSVPRDTLPIVLFGSEWQGQWWVPPGNSHMARLIQDAGGRYVFADRRGSGNIAIDKETMVQVGTRADIWGMIVDAAPGDHGPELFTGGDAGVGSFKAVRTGRLFYGNSRVVDLFGQALVEPDRVLFDLASILRSDSARTEGRLPYWNAAVRTAAPVRASLSPSATPGR